MGDGDSFTVCFSLSLSLSLSLQIAVTFADLHDTPGRMQEKGVVTVTPQH